jgi:predicted nucleic acid-binding Zn ribbon protein
MSDEAFRPPGDCPVCGEFVPRKAVACPGCGASRDSGWNEEAAVSGLDLPDDEAFDYDDFVAREFGQGQPKKPDRRRFWMVVGLVLIAAMVASWLAVFRFH